MTMLGTIPTTRTASRQADDSRRSSHDLTFALAVIVVYLLLGIVAFWPVLPWSSQRLFGTGADSDLAMWFLAWIPHSIAAGVNPLFSHAILEPAGVNLAQNTGGALLGLVTAPFSLFLGPVARANLLMVLAMPVSATAAFVVLRKWRVWGPASAIGGLIYGFSPFAVGQGLGHVVLVFVPLPPFIALTVVSIIRQERSPVRLGVQLGLLAAAQFLCEAEVMTSLAIVGAWGVLFAAIRFRSKVGAVAKSSVKSFGIAVLVALAILAYPIWMLLEGPQHYTGTAQPLPNPYYNDLLSFLNPGSLQRVSPGVQLPGMHLSNASELGGYIGIPVLIAAAFLVWTSRRSPRMQLAVAVFLGSVVLSLGDHLVIDGRNTHVPLPFFLFVHAPLLDNLLPSRFSLEIAAALAAIIGFGLDDLHRAPDKSHQHSTSRRSGKGVVATIVVLAAIVVTQVPRWPYASQVVTVLPEQVRAAVPAGDPLAITYPYTSPLFPNAMLWQVQDDFSFRLVGGYAEHPDLHTHPTGLPNATNPPDLGVFLEGQEGYNRWIPPRPVNSRLVNTTRVALKRNAIRLVLVDRSAKGAGAVVDLFRRALGPPSVSVSRFLMWVEPPAG
jgi:hypothetical protein